MRWLSRGVTAGAVLIAALLVFSWPFVRSPRLPLALSYLHLLGAWAGVVVLLFAMSRALAREPPDDADDGTDADA